MSCIFQFQNRVNMAFGLENIIVNVYFTLKKRFGLTANVLGKDSYRSL
jgi:hypothetical protein